MNSISPVGASWNPATVTRAQPAGKASPASPPFPEPRPISPDPWGRLLALLILWLWFGPRPGPMPGPLPNPILDNANGTSADRPRPSSHIDFAG